MFAFYPKANQKLHLHGTKTQRLVSDDVKTQRQKDPIGSLQTRVSHETPEPII